MGPKASSCHQCLEWNILTRQHYPSSPINLQAHSFLQASSMENPSQCNLLSNSVTCHLHFNPGREQYIFACFFD